MKQFVTFSVFFLFTVAVKGQSDSTYQRFMAQAGLYHLQKDYKNAVIYFEKAFELQQPDALNAYKAAGVYALDSNVEKAFYYLELALDSGWHEADWLSSDPYFDYLRHTNADKWRLTVQKAFINEKQYEQSLRLPALRKKISLMTLNDQRLRYKRVQTDDKNKIKAVDDEIHRSDLNNRLQSADIIKQHGWPKIADIGKDGQNNLWLIVQHADDDVLFQQAALAAMGKLKRPGELNPENYAFLYDRIQCNLNYKQLYGTQVNWTDNGRASGFRSIINEDLVDERRKGLGMSPLNIYALTYGFTYHPVTALQAGQNDAADLAQARKLIDSARYAYRQNEFQQVYDYYNAASMVPGGMTGKDNYEAALIFVKIAAKDSNEQYKSIALDFLGLVGDRRELTVKQLQEQKEFNLLHAERRWAELCRKAAMM